MKRKKLNKIYRTGQGFTLVELLVVIALLGISIGVTNDILTSLVRSYSKTQIKNEVEQQANFIGMKLEKELRNATSASSTSTSNMTIIRPDNTTVTYSVSGGVMSAQYSGNATTYPVTRNAGVSGVNVTCNAACFTVSTTLPQTVSMSIRLTAVSKVGASTANDTADVINVITIRKY